MSSPHPDLINLLKNSANLNTRSFIFISPDAETSHLSVLPIYYILNKLSPINKPNILWCYKKELPFTSHKKKRSREIREIQNDMIAKSKKRIKELQKSSNSVDDLVESYNKDNIEPEGNSEETVEFDLFLTSTEIRFVYYKETDQILGSTYSILIIQDFISCSPNVLCRIIECVRGGGTVIFLNVSQESFMDHLLRDSKEADIQSISSTIQHRFHHRFLKMLKKSYIFISPDLSEIHDLSILVGDDVDDKENARINRERDLLYAKQGIDKNEEVCNILKLSKTLDQLNTVKELLSKTNALSSTTSTNFNSVICALTASRGRGKSAAIGIVAACSILLNNSTHIGITSPSLENVKTVFEFIILSLSTAGLIEGKDFKIQKSSHNLINRIDICRHGQMSLKQSVSYVPMFNVIEFLPQFDLLLVDECGGIPLPIVKSWCDYSQVKSYRFNMILSSTTAGYEGTGRSLSLKLFTNLSTFDNFHRHHMKEPIRYAENDPIESFLNDLLLLNITPEETTTTTNTIDSYTLSEYPHPDQLDLFLYERDELFSGNYEGDLKELWSLFILSHYKNTPDDLLIAADFPKHYLFGLKNLKTNEILCALHVVAEGGIHSELFKRNVLDKLVSTTSAISLTSESTSGNLIPWTISRHYLEEDFAKSNGLRIIRIACHPSAMGKGYGKICVNKFTDFINNLSNIPESPSVSSAVSRRVWENESISTFVKDVDNILKFDYIGTCFGLSMPLFRFWSSLKFQSIYLRQTHHLQTGEHSSIFILPLSDNMQTFTKSIAPEFSQRLCRLLAVDGNFIVEHLGLELCFSLYMNSVRAKGERQKYYTDNNLILMIKTFLSERDLKRLMAFSKGISEYTNIADLLHPISIILFELQLSLNTKLFTVNQLTLFFGLGILRRNISDIVKKDFKNSITQVQLLSILTKGIFRLIEYFKHNRIYFEVQSGTSIDDNNNLKQKSVRSLEDEQFELSRQYQLGE